MKRIVITGALGHIGSELIRTVPASFPEAEIVLVDNLSSQRYVSLFELPEGVRYRFVELDVVTDDLDNVLEGADVCIHLAALTDAASSFGRAAEVEQVNLLGAERTATACAKANVPMVFVSTTSVYGPQGGVVDEDCHESDLRPQSPYAAAKLNAERCLAVLARLRGLRYVVLRFGTIFGPSLGMRFHTAVNKFCWLASVGKPLTVWRTAYEQRRPYLALDDGVRAIAFVLDKRLYDGQIYNVVTANLKVADIVETIQEFVPDLTVELVDAEIMNQHSYRVSAEKFAALGFHPQGDHVEGIRRTLARLQSLRHSPSSLLAQSTSTR